MSHPHSILDSHGTVNFIMINCLYLQLNKDKRYFCDVTIVYVVKEYLIAFRCMTISYIIRTINIVSHKFVVSVHLNNVMALYTKTKEN